jgi:hypothetical protein
MALALLLLTDAERPLFGTGTVDDFSRAIIAARGRIDVPSADDAW